MGWKERFTFRERRYVEHKVGENTLRFYPNRLGLLTEAKNLSAPAAKAIAALFADESRDTKSNVKRTKDGGEFYIEDITTDALTPEMAQHRQREKDRAIEVLFDSVCDMRNRNLIGLLLMDSLRDEFPYKVDRPIAEVEAFLYGDGSDTYTGLDIPLLIELVRGWLKGNAQVFGASGESMVGLVKAKLESLRDSRLAKKEPEGMSPTSGEPSKTPSSLQLVQDSPLST